jgi:hypothetical protein
VIKHGTVWYFCYNPAATRGPLSVSATGPAAVAAGLDVPRRRSAMHLQDTPCASPASHPMSFLQVPEAKALRQLGPHELSRPLPHPPTTTRPPADSHDTAAPQQQHCCDSRTGTHADTPMHSREQPTPPQDPWHPKPSSGVPGRYIVSSRLPALLQCSRLGPGRRMGGACAPPLHLVGSEMVCCSSEIGARVLQYACSAMALCGVPFGPV